jgi:hypothetical protein
MNMKINHKRINTVEISMIDLANQNAQALSDFGHHSQHSKSRTRHLNE